MKVFFDLVELSLLSSEAGTWGKEENVSSFMTHGLTTKIIVLSYIYAVVLMYKRYAELTWKKFSRMMLEFQEQFSIVFQMFHL